MRDVLRSPIVGMPSDTTRSATVTSLHNIGFLQKFEI